MPAEVTIVLKNDEKRQSHKHLIYENFTCDIEDPILKSLVDEASKQFNDEVEDIQIKIKVTVK